MKNCHDDYLFLKKKDKKNLLQIPNDIFLFFIRKLFLFQCELEFLNSVSLILVLYALFLVVYKGCFGNLSRKFLLGANSGAN